MDKKRIIEDGLLESYLLGTLPREDEALIQRAIENDQELKEQYDLLESEFELIGFENAIEPPARVRQRLIDSLNKASGGENRTLGTTKLLIAASMAALFALSSFWLYMQWQNSMDNINDLEQQTVNLQERLKTLEEKYESTSVRYTTISDPQMIPLYLVGNQISPNSRAVAYINHNDKTVVVNSKGLSELDTDHTYQMWADVDGEMINMGLLPTDQDYIPLRYIDKAESLNITIEPSGGSEHPTVEQLISNIYL